MGVNTSLGLGHFDIYKFEFAEYLGKEKNQIFKYEKVFDFFFKYIKK